MPYHLPAMPWLVNVIDQDRPDPLKIGNEWTKKIALDANT